jgi:hyaluronoglucosaminidase
VKGYMANCMCLAEASKIPLLTLAEFWNNPGDYQPAAALERAIHLVAGEDSVAALQLIAANTSHSFLGGPEGETLARLASKALAAVEKGQGQASSLDIVVLKEYLNEIDEATYHLKNRMENLALRNNLLPWIELLEHWMWMTRFALQALRAIETGNSYLKDLKRVHEYQELIQRHSKCVPTQSLYPLVDTILRYVEQDQRRRVSLEWAASVS